MLAHLSKELTGLLLAWRDGDSAALDELTPVVYAELHRMARRQLRGERPDHTLQPTALVNEVFLKLVDARRIHWHDRSHFLAVSARLMRQVLVDAARRRRMQKRGAGAVHVTFEPDMVVVGDRPHDLEALDLALEALASEDARKSQVVELRFFGGLAVEEVAAVLGISSDTVTRDWKLARAWLRRELRRNQALP